MLTEKKIKKAFYLSCLFDIIGFNNGEYEFKEREKLKNIENVRDVSDWIIYDFFTNGGFWKFNLKNKIASDDTVLNIITIKCLCDNNNLKDINCFLDDYKKLLIDEFNDWKFNSRMPGNTTLKYIKKLINNETNYEYDFYAAGSGCSMRSMSFGIIFYKKKDLKKLFEYVIKSSFLTHPNAIAI